MIISEKFWQRLRDNSFPILFLWILHFFISMEFPGYVFLSPAVNTFLKPIHGIIGMVAIVVLFTSNIVIEKGFIFSPRIHDPLVRGIKIASIIVSLLLVFVCIRPLGCKIFKDSETYFIHTVIYMVLIYYFLYRATQKRRSER